MILRGEERKRKREEKTKKSKSGESSRKKAQTRRDGEDNYHLLWCLRVRPLPLLLRSILYCPSFSLSLSLSLSLFLSLSFSLLSRLTLFSFPTRSRYFSKFKVSAWKGNVYISHSQRQLTSYREVAIDSARGPFFPLSFFHAFFFS